MCLLCDGTGYRREWVRSGVSTGTAPKEILWADYETRVACGCLFWMWPTPPQPYRRALKEKE